MSKSPSGVSLAKVPLVRVIAEWAKWRAHTAGENTVSTQLYALNQWFRGLIKTDTWPIASVDESHINPFVNTKEEVSRSTRNTRLAAIRSLFEYATAKAYVIGNPSKLVKVRMKGHLHGVKETKHRLPVSPAEYTRLMEDGEGFVGYAIQIGYMLGQRLGDICALEVEAFNPQAHSLTVWTMKRDKRVVLDLMDPLYGGGTINILLSFLLVNMKKDQTFFFPTEARDIMDPKRRSGISVMFNRHFARCMVKGKSFHCLRHSFATRLRAAGLSLEEIGKPMAHSQTTTTEIYAHKDTAQEIIADL